VGASIPATEHSVMTAWASERQAIENMIDTFGTGFFACVMDSYDYAEVGHSTQIYVASASARSKDTAALFWKCCGVGGRKTQVAVGCKTSEQAAI
jgi:nicotinic acid phosphoribosyltransferase